MSTSDWNFGIGNWDYLEKMIQRFGLYFSDLFLTRLYGIGRVAYISLKIANILRKNRKNKKKQEFVIGNAIGKFKINTENDTMMHSSIYTEFETRDWLKLPKDKKIFIDIGANIGFYSILATNKFGYKTAYAFEPSPLTFEMLDENIKLNKLDKRIKANNIGLGPKNSTLTFYAEEKRTGRASFIENNHAKKIKVKVETLDSFVKKKKIDPKNISFIKMDIEGFEYEALKGMKQTLKKMEKGSYMFLEIISEKRREIRELLSDASFVKIGEQEKNHLFRKK